MVKSTKINHRKGTKMVLSMKSYVLGDGSKHVKTTKKLCFDSGNDDSPRNFVQAMPDPKLVLGG